MCILDFLQVLSCPLSGPEGGDAPVQQNYTQRPVFQGGQGPSDVGPKYRYLKIDL